jgi:hypothetical protein
MISWQIPSEGKAIMRWYIWPAIAVPLGLAGGIGLMTYAQSTQQCPLKLGWMDDTQLTDDDIWRITIITGAGRADANNTGALGVIRSMQAGTRSGITCRDIELLRQDRRRAIAAYPDVPRGELLEGVWLQIDLENRIPESYNLSANASSSKLGETWYYDGPVYVSRVSAKFPNRASAEQTAAFYKARAKQ